MSKNSLTYRLFSALLAGVVFLTALLPASVQAKEMDAEFCTMSHEHSISLMHKMTECQASVHQKTEHTESTGLCLAAITCSDCAFSHPLDTNGPVSSISSRQLTVFQVVDILDIESDSSPSAVILADRSKKYSGYNTPLFVTNCTFLH